MGIINRIMGASDSEDLGAEQSMKSTSQDITDGALDTLGNVIRVMGDESFLLDGDEEGEFPAACREFARHVENGAAVPSFGISLSADGTRKWADVRRFFADRRVAEKSFVTERLGGYRDVVVDLVSGLKEISARDEETETGVMRSLANVESAVGTGQLPQITAALNDTIGEIQSTFVEQKNAYEAQLQELNERMSSLRQDLISTREEMKRDSLTQAYNRGAFDTAITQCVNAYFVLRQPITLLMIDLDNFKQINDTRGHGAGDEVLRAVGESLARSFIRKNDIIARYGGDEFAVILTDTPAENAANIIERFLKQVGSIVVPYTKDEFITCSIGYAEIAAEDTVEEFVNRADRALYKAKANGRNQAAFEAYEPPAASELN